MKRFLLLLFSLALPSCCETVAFEVHEGFLITATCTIGAFKNLVAVVDTGVTETTLDLRIAKRLSLTMRPGVASEGTRNAVVQAISIPNVAFGPIRSESLPGIAADLAPLTYQMGIRPDVLIGMDLLRRSAFLIDYKARIITFGASPTLKYSAQLIPEARLALLDVVADGKKLRLQIDTGFNTILVYAGKLRTSLSQELDSHSATFALPLRAQQAEVRELQIGNLRLKRVAAFVTDEAPAGDSGFDGLLGPRSLGIKRLSFDFDHHIVMWE